MIKINENIRNIKEKLNFNTEVNKKYNLTL